MGFKDLVVTRELETNVDSPYKKIAVLLHTDKALKSFESGYDVSLIFGDIPIGKWFVASYNELFEEPIIESIELLDEFIEDTTILLLSIAKELEWARNIIQK